MVEHREAPRSVQRLFNLFVAISDGQDGGATLAELSEGLNSPKSSLLNLLRPLVDGQYLIHEGNRYYLGPAVFNFASKMIGNSRYTHLIQFYLEELQRSTGETAIFAAFDGKSNHVTFVNVVESDEAVRYSAPSGKNAPLHSTVVGHAVLAYYPGAEVEEWCERHRAVLVAEQNWSKDRWWAGLREVRQNGFAFSGHPTPSGAGGVASAVLARDGRPIGAILVAAPVDRANQKKLEIQKALVTSTRALSIALGCLDYDSVMARAVDL